MTHSTTGKTVPAVRSTLIALWVGILLFYLLTLAPTVLWGDHAYFQRVAFEGILRSDGGGHWLWLQFARLFVGFPVGTVAYRANLLSAAAGTATLIFLSFAMRAIALSWASAVIACVSLAISHTFWMHSVRAEVYTVFTAVMALQLWLWLSWRPGRPWPIFLAAGLFGISLLAHQMAVLLLPSALFLLWKRRRWLSKRDWYRFLGLFLLGLAPFFLVVAWQVGAGDIYSNLRLYFTHAGVDFTPAMFDFSLSRLPRDIAIWMGLLGLQFVGPAGLLGLYGLGGRTLRSNAWLAMLILYATSAAFALGYHVNDQFVFFLPSYVAFSFFIANGYQRFEAAAWLKPYVARLTTLILIIIVPIALYAALPHLLASSNINPLSVRTLPGREPNRYFLWPGSSYEYGAKNYARTALEGLPPRSVMIADHTPLESMRYLQSIEDIRQDIELIAIEPKDELAPILRGIPSGTAVFVADNNPDYYSLTSLTDVCIEPFGTVYQLRKAGSSESCP